MSYLYGAKHALVRFGSKSCCQSLVQQVNYLPVVTVNREQFPIGKPNRVLLLNNMFVI